VEASAAGRVALVHDYWVHLRGGERMFLALTRLFPQADCYVLIRRRGLGLGDGARPLHVTPLRLVPFGGRYFRALLPLYPAAARHLDLRGYDLVISSSSGFCHGARTDGLHVCYCHSPLRYVWHERDATLAQARTPLGRVALARLLDRLRRADLMAARQVTAYVANSAAVRARIAAYYQRESTIVHPFIDLHRFQPRPVTEVEDYFLVVSELLPYKRVELAVEACTRLNRRLIVVGDGPERARLERLAGPTVTFYRRVSEAQLARLYAQCAAYVQCGVEDFGMAALEAQAAGRPVIAFGAGGALETVLPGETGVYFSAQTVEAVADALEAFDPRQFAPGAIRAHAERFDEANFRAGILEAIARARPVG
jgi:glycosyltransferase involved in cell wall biosynthesis